MAAASTRVPASTQTQKLLEYFLLFEYSTITTSDNNPLCICQSRRHVIILLHLEPLFHCIYQLPELLSIRVLDKVLERVLESQITR